MKPRADGHDHTASESPLGRSSDQFSANGFVANDFRICYIEVVLQRIGILGGPIFMRPTSLGVVDLMIDET
jgi:hypothetical protein